MVEVMKMMVTSFKRPQACSAAPSAPTPVAGHCRPTAQLETLEPSVSFGVTAPFSWVLMCTSFVCSLQESVSPVLCKFWQLYGGLMADLCHTQDLCHLMLG